MSDRDQTTEDAYSIPVLSDRCYVGDHIYCKGYCECLCHA